MYKHAYLYFMLALLVAIGGFYPSFFSRVGEADPVRLFHGVMATIWLLMLIAQSWLIAHRRVHAHRIVGRSSLIVVPLFVVSGLLVTHAMMAGQERGFVRAFGTMLCFIDLTTVMYFAWTYGMALRHRHSIQLHARYMASTAPLLLPPALARLLSGLHLPFINSFPAAVHSAYFLTELVIVALLLHDRFNGGVRRPYVILFAFTVMQHASMLITPKLGWLHDLFRAFGAL